MIVLDDYSKIPQSEQSSQSESELENELINDLINSGEYEYKADIKDENSLWQNAHKCIEELNDIKLSQSEWAQIKEYLKGKKREFKNKLIESINPQYKDLSEFLDLDTAFATKGDKI